MKTQANDELPERGARGRRLAELAEGRRRATPRRAVRVPQLRGEGRLGAQKEPRGGDSGGGCERGQGRAGALGGGADPRGDAPNNGRNRQDGEQRSEGTSQGEVPFGQLDQAIAREAGGGQGRDGIAARELGRDWPGRTPQRRVEEGEEARERKSGEHATEKFGRAGAAGRVFGTERREVGQDAD